ncbi:alkaline phosphatase [Colwellia psychrerythraea]|uniref:Alkaline phosphatase n=1 Tax=Colwellia psychrerythraea TaxID=28229 RepID=A0A099KDE9_COLPS|nr:alkaline phosphatase [Colwellia psychrerythraea]KGJ87578.1 Alkaline phosphatase [Colwellia psychrerythraea]
MKRLLSTVCITLALGACTSAEYSSDVSADKSVSSPSTPKNIIMIVGDGMGPAYTTAYRYFNDDPTTLAIEQSVFDKHYVGSSSTYPAKVSGYITDSAAAATALATGVKTYNDAISVDVTKKPLLTVLEWAKQQGKRTGVVVTSQINHATPASYLSHNENRNNYNAIADSYIDNGIKADVYFGGGWKYFIREDRNLVNEFKAAGFQYIDDYKQLSTLTLDKPVLGLFGDSGLPWALDDKEHHRLSLMTKAATKQLNNSNGYFMLIEASQIDWAGHGRDIGAAMAEMDDLAHTIAYLEEYVANNPDTLVVLTADHSTGGLSIGRKTAKSDKDIHSKYLWQPEILRTLPLSPQAFAKTFANNNLSLQQVNATLNFEISSEEMNLLLSAKQAGIKIVDAYQQLSEAQKQGKWAPRVEGPILITLKKMIDIKTNTGWGSISHSGTHTAVDVPVYAFGKGSELFKGQIDNTDIAKKIFTLLGKS